LGVLVDGVVALAEDARQARRLKMLLLIDAGSADESAARFQG
jgi:hypothetical protein